MNNRYIVIPKEEDLEGNSLVTELAIEDVKRLEENHHIMLVSDFKNDYVLWLGKAYKESRNPFKPDEINKPIQRNTIMDRFKSSNFDQGKITDRMTYKSLKCPIKALNKLNNFLWRTMMLVVYMQFELEKRNKFREAPFCETVKKHLLVYKEMKDL